MDRWMDGRMHGWMDEHLEIHPCILQDIGPLGPLPKRGQRQRQKETETGEKERDKDRDRRRR